MTGKPTTDHSYVCIAGRVILRDGVEFAAIHRCTDSTGAGPQPTDVDEFAHLCADAPALLAERDLLRAELAQLREAAQLYVEFVDSFPFNSMNSAAERADTLLANLRTALTNTEGGNR
jgi:hypothetical protein